jgi:hypothetical protein
MSTLLTQICTNAFASSLTIQTQLITAATIDLTSDTVTLPLYQGKLQDGRSLWYVLIDASDETVAKSLGLVYAPALANAATVASTRTATNSIDGSWILTFSHRRVPAYCFKNVSNFSCTFVGVKSR